jgi:hypothetical protein
MTPDAGTETATLLMPTASVGAALGISWLAAIAASVDYRIVVVDVSRIDIVSHDGSQLMPNKHDRPKVARRMMVGTKADNVP